MAQRPILDVFAHHSHRLSGNLTNSPVTVSHTSSGQFDPDAVLGAAPEDGFALVYRLADMPGHDFWNDDGYARVPPTAKGTLQIVDLRGGVSSRFESTFDNLHVNVPRRALDTLAEQIGARPVRSLSVPDLWETRDPMFEALNVGLLRAVHHPDEIDPLVADQLLLAMLAHVATAYGGMKRPSPGLRGALTARQLDRAKDLLAADLSAPPMIADIAGLVGVSPSHFSRAFKSAAGVAPSVWLLQHRIGRAKDMLLGSDLSLVDIAMRVGFADQSHFTHAFTRFVGTAPGIWRRRNGRT
jgi:AraC family transcriptional regulator